MSEHEPECWCRGCTHPHVCGRCRNCICDELRACEQRIRLADDDYAYVAGQAEADGRRRGWNEALDAARGAVNALERLLDVEKGKGGYDCCGCTTPSTLLEDALAAIDALKEDNDQRSQAEGVEL